jgi:hypothetical protein
MSDALMNACVRIDEQSALLDQRDAEIARLRSALENIASNKARQSHKVMSEWARAALGKDVK